MHNSNKHPAPRQPRLFEGLEVGDLARLVTPELAIDEFKSKMGADEDIIVLSFRVNAKEPAKDLMNFVERGYDWVLDADISSGELEDGEYVVFIEMERDEKAPEQIVTLIDDILNLTKQSMSEWKFKYQKNRQPHDINIENLEDRIPLTPEAYLAQFPEEEALDRHNTGDEELDKQLGAMQEAARVPMNRRAPVNDWTESLRVAAGLK